MAPEVICQQECSHKSDMWSIGCTLIEMFQTKPPWYELSPLAAAFAIGQGTSEPKFPEHLTQNARDIVLKCLNRYSVNLIVFVDIRINNSLTTIRGPGVTEVNLRDIHNNKHLCDARPHQFVCIKRD